MPKDSITDTSKPNAGRIYDYLLGGNHNFEVDRLAAGQLVQMFPFLPKSMRLQRWCLQDLAVEFSKKRGFDVIIDFASGLPTNDHLHVSAVPGTTIIYSDWDPIVVEYGREILEGVENVYYFHADARHPEELLGRPEVQDILKNRRDVAFITWGLSTFLEDGDITHMARVLYDWADKKSVWAFNAQGGIKSQDNATPGILRLIEFYKQMGTPVYYRPEEKYIEMLKPWRLEDGFVAFLDWHGLDKSFMTDEDLQSAGPGGGGYGAYLVK